jgi:iron(III) transport system permease protein
MNMPRAAQEFNRPHGFLAYHSRKILLGVLTAVVAYLVLPPIGMLLFSSIRATKGKLPFEATAFTLSNYATVFTSAATYKLLLNTAWFVAGSVLLALAIATCFAWFLERTNIPFRRLMFVLVLAPAGMPMMITSMAWILFANPVNGLCNLLLRSLLGLKGHGPINIYSVPGMIVITALYFVPVMYIMLSGVFARLDPSLEEASQTSGAGSWVTFRRISMPLLSPAILATSIYYTVRAMEIFEVPAMLGMPKGIYLFSTMIYFSVNPVAGGILPDYGLASTYAMVLLAAAGIFIYFYGRYTRHAERFITVTGRGYRPRLIDLGRWRLVPVLAMAVYFAFAVLMPLLLLLWTSVAPPYADLSLATVSRLNLNAYREALRHRYLLDAAKNTLIIASTLAAVAMLISTLVSWLSTRGGIRGGSIPDRIAFIVIGVPAVVLGLALIFIYTALPIPLYGTVWIIVIGLIPTCLPFGTRQMGAAMLQIHRELEEAAATSGANLWHTFSRVVLPLLWPSFSRGFLFMFVRGMRETTMALMLYTVGNQTLAVALWFLWTQDGKFALASAIAVPMMVATVLLSYLVARRGMLTRGGA